MLKIVNKLALQRQPRHLEKPLDCRKQKTTSTPPQFKAKCISISITNEQNKTLNSMRAPHQREEE